MITLFGRFKQPGHSKTTPYVVAALLLGAGLVIAGALSA